MRLLLVPRGGIELAGGSDRGRGRVRRGLPPKNADSAAYGHSLATVSRRGHRPRATTDTRIFPSAPCRLTAHTPARRR